MTSREIHTRSTEAVARDWIVRFDAAMRDGDAGALGDLFTEDAHWRDLVALTWGIRTTNGRVALVEGLLGARAGSLPTAFELSPVRASPSIVIRGEVDVVEFFVDFRTAGGTAVAVVRLDPSRIESGHGQAWGITTSLEVLPKELPPPAFAENFHFERHDTRVDWTEHRKQRLQYDDREPEVLVVGGGHGGLIIAARLKALGHDALVVEQLPRIGDNWRTRYDSLYLHTLTAISPFPFIAFPETFPQFLSKDQYAYWLESYAENLQLDVWTSSELVTAEYNEAAGAWSAKIRGADGLERLVRPQHVVMATGGFGAIPNRPQLPGLETFKGDVVHSSEFRSGEQFRGKSVLVVGVGVSAHDIMYDLAGRECRVAMLQRGSVTITSLYTAHLPFYIGQPPAKIEDGPLIANADFHDRWTKPMLIRATQEGREHDRELLEGLEKAGMVIDFGPEDIGYLYKAFHYGGGYYIDVGASALIAGGDIPVLQYDDIETFTSRGLRLQDGRVFSFDAVVLATGFLNPQNQVEEIFGSDVAGNLGEVFRLKTETGEFTNSWTPTAQEGLWFMNGGIAQAAGMSRYLAVNLSARLDRLKPM